MEEQDFTYNVIKSAEDLMEDGNIYKGLFGVAVYVILDDIDHNIATEAFASIALADASEREYKLIHEFYIRWRNSSTGQSA